MIHRPLITTVLAGLLCACASSDPNSQNPALPSENYTTPMGGPASSYVEAPVPSMDSTRKVNEQDCRQPVDLKAGNLRCK